MNDGKPRGRVALKMGSIVSTPHAATVLEPKIFPAAAPIAIRYWAIMAIVVRRIIVCGRNTFFGGKGKTRGTNQRKHNNFPHCCLPTHTTNPI